MSLQIWLPLDGNLKNKGVSGLTFSNVSSSNTTVSTSGKIGSCYNNNSFTAGGLVSNKTINLGTKQSMFCWIKFTSFNPEASLSGICGQHRYSNCTGMGITAKYNTSTTGYVSVNTGNGSDRTYVTYAGNTLMTAGNWYHIGYTYDGTTIKLYLNGHLDGTHTVPGMAVPADFFQVFSWSFNNGTVSDSSLFGGYKTQSSINDVRVYDHCLSEKEVREISLGLMMHYQLKGNGKTNYLKGSGAFTEQNPLIRSASEVGHMYDSYVYHTNVLTAIIPSAGDYTFSVRCDGNPTGHPTSGTTASSRLFSLWLYNDSTGVHYHSTCTRGKDGRCYVTLNLPAGSYTVRTNLYAADNVNYTVKFWDMKVASGVYEPNDMWCPHVEDALYSRLGYNSTVEQDCSGFEYNATKTGTFSAETGSMRYGTSYLFNGSAYMRSNNILIPTVNTISLWVYRSNSNCHVLDWRSADGGTGFQPLYFNEYGQIQYWSSAAASAANDYFSYKFNANTWYHIVLACEGTVVKLYVNGVLQESKATGLASGWTLPLTIGARCSSENIFSGKLADFRVYATALSASDVATLYKASGSVDSKKNIWAYEFIQKDTGSMKVYNSGVWNFADMLETDDGEDTSIYEI